MSDNVIPLKPAEELGYWKCDCGCLTHYVRSDGEIECARCEIILHGAPGHWLLPEGESRREQEGDPPTSYRHDLGGPADAFAETLAFVQEKPSDALVAVQTSGIVRAWGRVFDTKERRDWLKNKLDTAYKLLTEGPNG